MSINKPWTDFRLFLWRASFLRLHQIPSSERPPSWMLVVALQIIRPKYISKIYSAIYYYNNDERGIEKCTIICLLCSLLDLFYGEDSKWRICRILNGFSDKKHGILQDINSKPHLHKILSQTAMLSPTRHFYFFIDNRWFLHWCHHYAHWLVQSTYFLFKTWLMSHHWWPQLPWGQIRHIQYVETDSTWV